MNNATVSKFGIALGGIIALAVSIGFGRFVYTPILPSMISTGILDESQAGTIATINYVGYLLGAFAIARYGRFFDPRNLFLLSLLINAAMTIAMGLFENLLMLGLIRFVSGVTSAFAFVLAATLVVNHLTRIGATNLYGIHFIGVGTGIAVSAMLVAGLENLDMNWQQLWVIGGLLSLVGAVATVKLFPPEKVTAVGNETSEPEIQFSWVLFRLVLAYGLFGVGYVITATFINTIVNQEESLRVLEPYIWLLVGLSAIPSAAIMTKLAVYFGNRVVFSFACLLEALGVAISVLGGNPTMVALGAMLFGGTFVGITAVGLIEAGRLAKGSLRRVFGYMTASFGVGQIVGPFTAGVMHSQFGSFTIASLMASLLLVCAALLTLWPVRTEENG